MATKRIAKEKQPNKRIHSYVTAAHRPTRTSYRVFLLAFLFSIIAGDTADERLFINQKQQFNKEKYSLSVFVVMRHVA